MTSPRIDARSDGHAASPAHRARRIRRTRRAFSLLELLIAIAIMLALAGVVVVNLLPARDQSKIDLSKVQVEQMVNAMRRFNLDLGRYPTEDEGLASLWSRQSLEDTETVKWRGPYLEKPLPRDAWDNEWVYRAPSTLVETAPFDIVSPGPDGEEGTEDDIHNHLFMLDERGEMREGFDTFDSGGLSESTPR
ncbi:MAG: type II secretion system major pseudopilin GspG [Phycisphaeraceae bacterium]|nr:type II secretion system major pseudopilin GspG [Phycisphaeraceae bacterium]